MHPLDFIVLGRGSWRRITAAASGGGSGTGLNSASPAAQREWEKLRAEGENLTTE
jgi:hypothetical protein